MRAPVDDGCSCDGRAFHDRSTVGLYLGQSSVASSYGATGSVMILLLWVYYSCQILLLGAEFTRAYALRQGTQPDPESFAEKDLDALGEVT